MPELLGRSEIGHPPAGAKTNQLITKHMHTKVLFKYDQSVKKTKCSR